jgi:hypothetical protein
MSGDGKEEFLTAGEFFRPEVIEELRGQGVSESEIEKMAVEFQKVLRRLLDDYMK